MQEILEFAQYFTPNFSQAWKLWDTNFNVFKSGICHLVFDIFGFMKLLQNDDNYLIGI